MPDSSYLESSKGSRHLTVLITGAGASMAFGKKNEKPQLPAMVGWSNYLLDRIESADKSTAAGKTHDLLALSGISRGMDAQQFEEALGRFLEFAQAYEQAFLLGIRGEMREALLSGIRGSKTDSPRTREKFEAWFEQTKSRIDRVVSVIHSSMYELYSAEAVDIPAASRAYRGLLLDLGIQEASPLVVATTNYDLVNELAIEALGMRPDAGIVRSSSDDGIDTVDVRNLIGGIPRFVPILHLHGRLGWYKSADRIKVGRIGHSAPIVSDDDPIGERLPLVILPSPRKNYRAEPVTDALWRQFGRALRSARRVLVLGHSLGDEAISELIKANVDDIANVAVGIYEWFDGSSTMSDSHTSERAFRQLPGAVQIPIEFGAMSTKSSEQLRRWSSSA